MIDICNMLNNILAYDMWYDESKCTLITFIMYND